MSKGTLAKRVGVALLAGAGFLWVTATAAQEPAGPIQRAITVSGQGEAKAVPDEAHLSAGVVTEARKAADALAANSTAMNGVFAALRHLGISDKSIQTSGFSIAPQYANDREGNETPKIGGYQVSNEVTVVVDDPRKVGPAIDALAAAGANSLGNISFTIRDPKPLQDEARADAIKDAIARAQTYAAAGGFTLGPILAVSEGAAEPPPRPFAMSPMRMAAAPPIAAGQSSVSASVSVTFEIR
jgi:uncharacterized protein